MAEKTLRVYNLTEHGVDVDTDNLHVAVGAFRSAQNLHRSSTAMQTQSLVTRRGLTPLNTAALGTGPILGGIVLPVFEAGDGESTLLLGFGD